MEENLINLVLKPSRYAFIYQRNNDFAIYHSRLMETIYLSKEAMNIFLRFKSGNITSNIIEEKGEETKDLISKLVNTQVLVPLDDNEEKFSRNSYPKEGIDIRLMYFFPTDICNFRCQYCFIESVFPIEHKFIYMNEETAKRGLDLFFRISKADNNDKRRILFYGGEPLINQKIISFALDYISKHPKSDNTSLHLITNGSLITPEFAKTLRVHKVNVSLSLDGPKEINDHARVYANGKGTFQDVKKGYHILKNSGIENIGISFTVGAHNVENLKENLEYLLSEFDIKGMGFNFITDFPSGKNPYSVSIDLATDKVIEAFQTLRNKGIYEERIMRKLKPFVERKIHLKDCGAIGNQIVLAPNGDIGPCHAFIHSKEYFNHNVYEDEINLYNDSVYKEWCRRMPINIKECQDCPAIAICGGGCPYQAKITKGSIWKLDDRMCQHNKKFLEWAIWDAYDQNDT